jgi:hypothetical protein
MAAMRKAKAVMVRMGLKSKPTCQILVTNVDANDINDAYEIAISILAVSSIRDASRFHASSNCSALGSAGESRPSSIGKRFFLRRRRWPLRRKRPARRQHKCWFAAEAFPVPMHGLGHLASRSMPGLTID